jgi:hypothetical protein
VGPEHLDGLLVPRAGPTWSTAHDQPTVQFKSAVGIKQRRQLVEVALAGGAPAVELVEVSHAASPQGPRLRAFVRVGP